MASRKEKCKIKKNNLPDQRQVKVILSNKAIYTYHLDDYIMTLKCIKIITCSIVTSLYKGITRVLTLAS